MKKWKFIIFFLLFCNFSRSQNFSDTSLIKYPEGQYWSIVSESLVSMYREPSHKSELISQALLGTPIKVIAKDKNWYQVQTPEGYKGWVNAPIKYINRKTWNIVDARKIHTLNFDMIRMLSYFILLKNNS